MTTDKDSLSRHNLLVYNASAGSGKTFTLAARYIALLMDGNEARTILAVTFTNKATAEMKRRILTYLYVMERNINDASIKDFVPKVRTFMRRSLTDAELQQRAGRQLKNILDDYDHFTVVTIDAFLQLLLGEVARIAGLQTNYRVELDSKDVIDEAIDLMLANMDELEPALKNKLKNYIRQEMDDEHPWDVRRQLKALAMQLQDEHYLKEKEKIDRFSQGHLGFGGYRAMIDNHFRSFLQNKAVGLMKEYDRMAGGVEWTCGNKTYQKTIDNFISRFRKAVDDPTDAKAAFTGLTFAARTYIESEKFDQKVSGLKETAAMKELLLRIDDAAAACRNCFNTTQACKAHLNDMELLNDISRQVNRINAEANRLLLSMTPILLRDILKEGVDTMFVLEKAGIRFNHVMIDEFQDTSAVQWDNFLPLLGEVLSRGGTTLLVGDVKQSIYRWRGGDWNILKNIGREALSSYFNNGIGHIEPLNKNFRSDTNIVAFNLSFFPKAAVQLDALHDLLPMKRQRFGSSEISEIYDEKFNPENLAAYCRHSERKTGYVDIRLYPKRNSRKSSVSEVSSLLRSGAASASLTADVTHQILENLFSRISELRREGVQQKDMLILVRHKREISDIVSYYENHKEDPELEGLVLTSADAFKLKASVSVCLIVCALRWLADRRDRVALVYLVLHYQNDILGTSITWDEAAKKGEALLPEVFRKPEVLLAKPLYEMVEELAGCLLYKSDAEGQCVKVLHDDSYVFCFMDALLSYLDSNTGDLKLFVEYWNDKLGDTTIPTTESGDGVQVMTIHKAKGLERNTVFVPFCDWDIEKDKRAGNGMKSSILWCEPTVKPYDALPAVPVEPVSALSESILKDDYADEHFKRRIDNLNLLYVAFTRPRHRLIVTGVYKVPSRNTKALSDINTVADLLAKVYGKKKELEDENVSPCGVLIYKEGEEKVTSAGAKGGEGDDRLHLKRLDIEVEMLHHESRMQFRQSNDSKQYIEKEVGEKDIDTQREYIRTGNLMHLLLSKIGNRKDADAAVASLHRQGLIESERFEKRMCRLLDDCWGNEQMCSWFDGSWQLFTECNILLKKNGKILKRRPDRVMVKDGEAVVVDFKYARRSTAHVSQVNEYVSFLKEMGYRRVSGYLWYGYEKQVVECAQFR